MQKTLKAAENLCRFSESFPICFKKGRNFRLCAADPSLLADWFAAATAVESLGQGFAQIA
jgi:hypothetical protein